MILTLAEYKTLKGISDTSQDTIISAFLPLVDSEIKEYTRNDFLVDEVETIPDALKIIAMQMTDELIKDNSNITSQSVEGNSVSFDTTFSQKYYTKLQRYRILV